MQTADKDLLVKELPKRGINGRPVGKAKKSEQAKMTSEKRGNLFTLVTPTLANELDDPGSFTQKSSMPNRKVRYWQGSLHAARTMSIKM